MIELKDKKYIDTQGNEYKMPRKDEIVYLISQSVKHLKSITKREMKTREEYMKHFTTNLKRNRSASITEGFYECFGIGVFGYSKALLNQNVYLPICHIEVVVQFVIKYVRYPLDSAYPHPITQEALESLSNNDGTFSMKDVKVAYYPRRIIIGESGSKVKMPDEQENVIHYNLSALKDIIRKSNETFEEQSKYLDKKIHYTREEAVNTVAMNLERELTRINRNLEAKISDKSSSRVAIATKHARDRHIKNKISEET